MLLLDLYCGAGGASYGYKLAGFEVHGVDICNQTNYKYTFWCEDAVEFLLKHWKDYDCIHASPPCQEFSVASCQDGYGRRRVNPNRSGIERLMSALGKINLPYVVENVPAAPIRKDLMLCGKMFNLDVVRHRIFSTSGVYVPQPRHVYPHMGMVITVAGNSGGSSRRDGSMRFSGVDDRKKAMQIDWMTNRELVEAVPPTYTRYIGMYLKKVCTR